ncbi:recombinase family protein [Streptomyces erythrochromogenes]|uniref:recombinase family protein n=1 Tax=Streptomyces erythrochromogenes TaxID=285574 RepID=UPI003801F820
MGNLVYKRVSTDQQSTARQNLVLDQAGIADPVVFEEDPGTSSRLHPLQRPRFRELLTYARPGDTVHISEMFRLVRGAGHILDVLDVLHRDQMALRIHDGAFSAMDLSARHPRTGELLSTVKFMVQTLAAAGELQHDLQGELIYDGLRAAEAKGSKGGRRPAVAADKTGDVRTAYLEGLSIAALARDHGVPRRDPHSRRRPHARAHRHRGGRPGPGAAGHPRHAGQGRRLPPRGRPGARRAGRAKRGRDRTARPGLHPACQHHPAIHRQLLARCQPLDNTAAIPAQRKARREYANRVNTLSE